MFGPFFTFSCGQVQDAYQVLEELRDPTFFDGSSEETLLYC